MHTFRLEANIKRLSSLKGCFVVSLLNCSSNELNTEISRGVETTFKKDYLITYCSSVGEGAPEKCDVVQDYFRHMKESADENGKVSSTKINLLRSS